MKLGKMAWVLRILALVFVIRGTIGLYSLHNEIEQNKAQTEGIARMVETLEQENKRLQEDLEALKTDEGLKAAARKELGMVASGEIVFHDIGH